MKEDLPIFEKFKRSGITLVGFAGRKGSGKSTFARELAKNFSFHVPMAFADPVRSVALAVFGSEFRTHAEKDAHDSFWEERLGSKWATGRAILQQVGTDLFRNNVSQDIWLYAFERRLWMLMAKLKPGHPLPLVTVDDIRYDNESKLIHDLGGKVIKLINTALPPNDDFHASEAGISDTYVDHTYEVATEEDVAKIARAYAWCSLNG